jgi:DNA replication protein DnaC
MSAIEILETQLKQLRLSGMVKVLPIRLHEAEVGDLPYHQFLSNLIGDQLNHQTSTTYNRKIKEARFPFLKTVEEFDFTFNTSIRKRDVMDLLTCRFVLEKRNVLFVGPPGVGKTHLAIATGISAIKKGYGVSFYSIYDLLELMTLAQISDTKRSLIKELVQTPILIIDEFGMKSIPTSLSEDLMEIFHRRYGKTSTMICTNRPVEDWGKILGDVPAASAILDRLLEGIVFLKMTGRSYRLQGDPIDKKEVSSEKEES